MTHGSLFSGIGGFDLAAEWMGWENVFHCEWNEFGQKILKHYWPNAISYGDITKTDFKKHRGTIDVLTGGFPCQGFSVAGQRLGTDDDRYLWPQMLRAIRESQPNAVVAENVTGILSMEDKSGIWSEIFPKVESRKITRFDTVDNYEAIYSRQAKMLIESICEDLEKEGYQVIPFVIPAAAIGAPHKRERVWIVAYRTDTGIESMREQKVTTNGFNAITNPTISGLEGCGNERICRSQKQSNGDVPGLRTGEISQQQETEVQRDITPDTGRSIRENGISGNKQKREAGEFRNSSSQLNNWSEWPTQSPLCSRDDGFSSRLDGITFPKWRNESIKGYGNAIVPQVAYQIFKAIKEVA